MRRRGYLNYEKTIAHSAHHAVAGVKVDDAVRRAVMVCIDRHNAEVEKVAGCLKRHVSRPVR